MVVAPSGADDESEKESTRLFCVAYSTPYDSPPLFVTFTWFFFDFGHGRTRQALENLNDTARDFRALRKEQLLH
jgi:hypothetical protein